MESRRITQIAWCSSIVKAVRSAPFNELTEVVADYFDDVALQSGAQLSEWKDLFR